MIELRRRYSAGVQSPSFSRLPAGYQEVEYIQNTGDSYIVLDFMYADIKFKFVVTPDDSRQSMQMGYGGSRMVGFLKESGVAAITPVINGVAQSVSIPSSETTIHTIEIRHSDAALIIDGVNAANGDSFTNDTIFSIFYRIPSTIPKMKGKIYVLQRNYGEGYIDQYIPCYRISDRKPGMYDIVNDVFYTNDGAGEFLYGQDVHYNIPPEYQQVEYLESTGTQYIVTDIPANDGTDVTIDFQLKAVNQQTRVVFGVRSIISERWYLYIENMTQWNFGHGENKIVNISNATDRHIVNYITSEDKRAEIDGVLVKSFTSQVKTELGIYIFYANNPANEPMYPCVAKIFSFKAKDTITNKDYHLIPCYKKETLIAGMYDIVNGVFYTNAGTGEFTVGPLVI